MVMLPKSGAGENPGTVPKAPTQQPVAKAKAKANAKQGAAPKAQHADFVPKVPARVVQNASAAKAAGATPGASKEPLLPPPLAPPAKSPPGPTSLSWAQQMSKKFIDAQVAKEKMVTDLKAVHKAVTPVPPATADGNAPPDGGQVAVTTSWFVPYFVYRDGLLEKTDRTCVNKAWRGWDSQLQNLVNNDVLKGYHIPKQFDSKGKSAASGTTLIRIAMDQRDIQRLTGQTPSSMVLLLIRKLIAKPWFEALCALPAMYYVSKCVMNILGGLLKLYLRLLLKFMVRRNLTAIATANYMTKQEVMGLFTTGFLKSAGVFAEDPEAIQNSLRMFGSIGLAFVARLLTRLLDRRQAFLVLRISSQAFDQTHREIGNAEQEKSTAGGIATVPALTRVANECLESAKAMHPVWRVQYTAVAKLFVAGVAQNVAQLHDHVSGEMRAAADHFAGQIKEKMKAEAEPPKSAKALADEAGKKQAAALGYMYVGTQAESAELKDLELGTFELLNTRTSTIFKETPSILRDSVKIKRYNKDKIFEEKQRGRSVKFDGDEKHINYAGIIFSPELLKVISSLESNATNEEGGGHRHLKKLEHPKKHQANGKPMLLPKPQAAAEIRMDKAARVMAKHFAATAEMDLGSIAYWSVPGKWGQEARDTQPELAEQHTQYDGSIAERIFRRMAGFCKTGEFMVDPSKLPRLIGNQGMTANAEDAMSYAPLEHMMLKWYEHLVTKGKSMDEIDEEMVRKIRKWRAKGMRLCSDDYRAMDSSWTLNDRRRLHEIACAVLRPMERYLNAKLRAMDLVLEADEFKTQIKWHLGYIQFLMDPEDSPLFSGERPTSLKNRWLVLIGKFAEEFRFRSDEEAEIHINKVLDGEEDETTGDGDDEGSGIPEDRYFDEEHRVNNYAEMHKILTPVSHWEERTDLEVLSRYHIWREKEDDYVHVAKLQRQMGRLIAFKIERSGIHPDITTTSLTQKELITICTDVWMRSYALRSTMVVRQFARMVFEFAYSMVLQKEATAIFSESYKYLEDENGQHELQGTKLSACYEEILEGIANAPCSGLVMVKVAHFKTFHDLARKDIEEEAREWEQAEECWSTASIDWAHLVYPSSLIETFPISLRVADALGLQDACLAVIRAKATSAPKNDEPGASEGQPPARNHADGNLGELASVATLASPGATEFSSSDSACDGQASSSGTGNTVLTTAEVHVPAEGPSGTNGGENIIGHLEKILEVKTTGKPKSNADGVGSAGESGVVESCKKSLVLDQLVADAFAPRPVPAPALQTVDVAVQKLKAWKAYFTKPHNAELFQALVNFMVTDNAITSSVELWDAIASPELICSEGQATSTETSREPGSQAEPGRVGSPMARTKETGQLDVNPSSSGDCPLAAEGRGNLEPTASLGKAMDATGGVKRRKVAAAKLNTLGPAINAPESQTHGSEKTDTTGGAGGSASAGPTTSPEGTVAVAAVTPHPKPKAKPKVQKKKPDASWIRKGDSTPSDASWRTPEWQGYWESHAAQAWSSSQW